MQGALFDNRPDAFGRDDSHRLLSAAVAADPADHVVIPPDPLHRSSFVPDFSKPIVELIGGRRAGQRQDRLHVRHTIKAIKGSHEDFRYSPRADQWIYGVGTPQKMAGENFHS